MARESFREFELRHEIGGDAAEIWADQDDQFGTGLGQALHPITHTLFGYENMNEANALLKPEMLGHIYTL